MAEAAAAPQAAVAQAARAAEGRPVGAALADPDVAGHQVGAGGAAAWAPLLHHQAPVAAGHPAGAGEAAAWPPLLHYRAWAVASHPAVAGAVAAWVGLPRHHRPPAQAGAAPLAVEVGVEVLARPRRVQA